MSRRHLARTLAVCGAMIGMVAARHALAQASDLALLNSVPAPNGGQSYSLPVQTLLWGALPDQAALQGVLDHLDELGVEILEVNQLPDRTDEQAEYPA